METIYFERHKKLTQRADNHNSVTKPKDVPCIEFVFNDNWNDYEYYTWFTMWYVKDFQNYIIVGDLKIMHKDGNPYKLMKRRFTELGDDFCSVGMDVSYYSRLVKVFGNNVANQILLALNDCAVNDSIRERFADKDCFKTSLLREISTTHALEKAKKIVSMEDPSQAYAFEYKFVPEEDNSVYSIFDCHFEYPCAYYKRTFALIGENGVGKTHLLSLLIKDMVCRNEGHLSHIPLFQECFVICSSLHDEYYRRNEEKHDIPVEICRVVQDENLHARVRKLLQSITNRGTVLLDGGMYTIPELFMEKICNQLGKELVGNLLYRVKNEQDKYERWELDEKHLEQLLDYFSTGQRQIFLLTVNVFAKLKPSTLVVIDEPEVHLHTSLIMNFICELNDFLNCFKSYAIIATHSPLVVREVVRSNVFLMRRVEGNVPLISEAHFETFGANISDLYKYIFGYDCSDSYFCKVIRRFAEEGMDYKEVVNELKRNDVEVSLNSRFEIRDIIREYNEND